MLLLLPWCGQHHRRDTRILGSDGAEYPDARLPHSSIHPRDLVFCRPDGECLQLERFTREFQRAPEGITTDIYTHVRRPMQSDATNRVAAMIYGQ